MAASAPHAAMHAAPASAPRVTSGTHALASGYPHYVRTPSGAIVLRMAPRATTPVRTSSTGTGRSSRSLLSQDTVPGLGFDYAHVAAVHPNGIHGHDHNRGFNAGYFPLFYGGGYYFPLSADDEDAPAADGQQADNSAPEPVESAASRPGYYEPRSNRAPVAQVSVDAAEAEPEPYVFVRRDGTLFFATAYAWENGTLRYITSEGLRRTVTSDKLDLDATQQFNEQRGLTFRAPAA